MQTKFDLIFVTQKRVIIFAEICLVNKLSRHATSCTDYRTVILHTSFGQKCLNLRFWCHDKINNVMHLLHLLSKTSWVLTIYGCTTIVFLLQVGWLLSSLPGEIGKVYYDAHLLSIT